MIDDGIQPEATVIIKANGKEMHEADTGVGPVDALAKVLKKSLKSIFPEIDDVKLIDFFFQNLRSGSGYSRWRGSRDSVRQWTRSMEGESIL